LSKLCLKREDFCHDSLNFYNFYLSAMVYNPHFKDFL
jgi:hypothetical protein